jgi:hypothetical protein
LVGEIEPKSQFYRYIALIYFKYFVKIVDQGHNQLATTKQTWLHDLHGFSFKILNCHVWIRVCALIAIVWRKMIILKK